MNLANSQRVTDRPEGVETPHERTAMLCGQAGRCLSQGQYALAESLYRKALELAETVYGPHSVEVANICNNLGVVYKYTANFDEASKLYLRALTILERE